MNYWAIVVSAVVSMIIGMFWYSPKVFGTMWAKLARLDPKIMNKAKKESMTGYYIAAFVSSIVMGYVLYRFVYWLNVTTFLEAMVLAVWIWLGFIGTTTLSTVLWERKPFKLYLLNNAYYLITFIIMAWILAVWR